MVITLIKYKPVYEVTLEGAELGYVDNKEAMNEIINQYINNKEGNIAYVTVDQLPQYEFKFVKNTEETSEEEVLLAVKEKSVVTYLNYAIKLDGERKQYVDSLEEAENIINSIKEQYNDDIELDLSIEEVYTEDTLDIVEIEVAKAEIDSAVNLKIDAIKQEKGIEAEIDGVELSRPISGKITSRYGVRSSIRSGAHTGLDIAAPNGTPIKPASSGTVTFAGSKGSYGNLIIISHGNGIETYYAHCSKLYAKVGDEVTTDTVIGLVGSTGNSTGNHLHLEIRKDGQPLNPQEYLYK